MRGAISTSNDSAIFGPILEPTKMIEVAHFAQNISFRTLVENQLHLISVRAFMKHHTLFQNLG